MANNSIYSFSYTKDPLPHCSNHIDTHQYTQGHHCWCTAIRKGGVNLVQIGESKLRCPEPLSERGKIICSPRKAKSAYGKKNSDDDDYDDDDQEDMF